MLDRESLALAFIILAAFPAQIWLSQGKLSEEKKYLVPPPQSIEHFTFGFGPSIADSLWLRWVQDSDTCQSYGEYKERPALPSEDSKNFLKNPRHKVCDYSWGFQMLDAISKIQPRFKEVYSMGLIILAVMVEDYKGSTILYNRGLKEFPDDWRLNYQAAFHFLGDEEDLPRAARLLEHAAETGGNPWFKSLAARVYTRSGQYELGISTLESYKKLLTSDEDKAKIDARIKDLRTQEALSGEKAD